MLPASSATSPLMFGNFGGGGGVGGMGVGAAAMGFRAGKMAMMGVGSQMSKTPTMNKYKAMTYVLAIGNIVWLVAMFIAAFWGFTYPKIQVDGYESGKSAYVAAFLCVVSGVCLCGLNFHNYYLLVTYAVMQLLFMLNQLFKLLPFAWTRIANYPITGSVATQVYIELAPKLLLVGFAFALAYNMRAEEKQYELNSAAAAAALAAAAHHHRPPSSAGMHQLPGVMGVMHSMGTQAPQGPQSSQVGVGPGPGGPYQQPSSGAGSVMSGQAQQSVGGGPGVGAPPNSVQTQPLPPPPQSGGSNNQIIQTPPIYPLHRPSVTELSIGSPNRPLLSGGQMGGRGVGVGGGGNHSSSCAGGLNGLGMDPNDAGPPLTRTRSSGLQWSSNGLYEPLPTTPTKCWYAAKQQQQQQQPQPPHHHVYRPQYYRDVYNPNF